MQAPRPQGNPVRPGSMPGVRVGGGYVSGEHFGAGKWKDIQHAAQAAQGFGQALMHEDQNRRMKEDEAAATEANNQMHIRYNDGVQEIYDRFKGQDASKIPAEIEKFTRSIQQEISKGLANQHQRDAFGKSSEAYMAQVMSSAFKQRDQQTEEFRINGLQKQNMLVTKGVANMAGAPDFVKQAVSSVALEIIRINTDKMTEGQPEEARELARNAAAATYHTQQIEAAGAASPEQALEYLNQDAIKSALPAAKVSKYRQLYGKELISTAKKQAENEMRRIGISLGDQYDHEYEVIDALRDIEDRDLARIAREEAETVRKARLAMGAGKGATAEERARENRMARERAVNILKGRDPDSDDDDIVDENEIDAAIDEHLPDETEVTREKVRKYAMAELKSKQARQARDRRALDEKAMQAMVKAGWDVAAIDPSWPEDLQDKMQDRALKREEATARREDRMAKAEKRAKGLEYLEMPLDQLNAKILAGEWVDIVEDVGAGTPEHNKLAARLKGEDSGGLTMLQYAKNEFTRIVGDPSKKKKRFAEFNQKVGEARAAEAKALKLDNPDMIPMDKQKKIIKDMLVEGDFRYWEWSGHLSPNKYRFEVQEEDIPNWKPYGTPVPSADDLPSFAQSYFGPRDHRREVLANGNVLIESSTGTITIVKPDGSILNTVSKGTE